METTASTSTIRTITLRNPSGVSQRPGQKGFTLVELLVSVFIFSMVMLVAVGSLLSMVDANRKAQTIKSAVNNLSFALDGMSRAIRVGTTFRCGTAAQSGSSATLSSWGNCVNTVEGGSLIAFEAYGGNRSNSADQWVYCRGTGTTCSESGTAILRSQNGGANYQSITSSEVTVEDLRFYVVGVAPRSSGSMSQPRIVMVMHGYAGSNEKTKTEIRLQTTMTPRLLDE